MRYGPVQKIALFKKTVVGTQTTMAQFGASDPPLEAIRADGTNLYVDAGVVIQQGGVLSPDHAAIINDVAANVKNGVLNLGLEPSTAYDDEGKAVPNPTPSQLHGYVAANQAAITAFFVAVDQLIGNGLTVVVRYASEFNTGNVWSQDPVGFQAAVRVVNAARVGTGILLTFAPAINEAEGDWVGADAGHSIRSYWIPGLFDVVSCTFYARPQSDKELFADAATRSLNRLNRYLNNVQANAIGIDELGGSETWDGNSPVQNNDGAIQHIFNNLPVGPFLYATIFLEKYWGRDATLHWLNVANPGA